MLGEIRSNIRFGIVLPVLLCFALLFCGCGKKGDPKYSVVDYHEVISDLNVSEDGERAVLNFTISEGADIDRVKIYRSEIGLDSGDCPECPREYREIADLSLSDPTLEKKKDGGFMYSDYDIKRGFLYSYRISACGHSGMCGNRSNAVDFIYR
jgi:hypothetical protein